VSVRWVRLAFIVQELFEFILSVIFDGLLDLSTWRFWLSISGGVLLAYLVCSDMGEDDLRHGVSAAIVIASGVVGSCWERNRR
jgi:hypothetical protein